MLSCACRHAYAWECRCCVEQWFMIANPLANTKTSSKALTLGVHHRYSRDNSPLRVVRPNYGPRSLEGNNCMSDAQILIADDMQTNRNLMKVRLGKIFPDRSVQLFDNAEALVQQDLSHAKVLIIDNHFGTDKMTGVEAVQLIRSNMTMTLPLLSGHQARLMTTLVQILFGQRLSAMRPFLQTSRSNCSFLPILRPQLDLGPWQYYVVVPMENQLDFSNGRLS